MKMGDNTISYHLAVEAHYITRERPAEKKEARNPAKRRGRPGPRAGPLTCTARGSTL